jgi:hypothetical protein
MTLTTFIGYDELGETRQRKSELKSHNRPQRERLELLSRRNLGNKKVKLTVETSAGKTVSVLRISRFGTNSDYSRVRSKRALSTRFWLLAYRQ